MRKNNNKTKQCLKLWLNPNVGVSQWSDWVVGWSVEGLPLVRYDQLSGIDQVNSNFLGITKTMKWRLLNFFRVDFSNQGWLNQTLF
jgi:hypothetical protein